MINITTNQNSVIIEEIQESRTIQSHIFFRNELSFRVTNPNVLVLYKIEDPDKIFLQDQLQNVTVDGTTLTTDNYEATLSKIFLQGSSGGTGGGVTPEELEVILEDYLIKDTTDNQGAVNVISDTFTVNGNQVLTTIDISNDITDKNTEKASSIKVVSDLNDKLYGNEDYVSVYQIGKIDGSLLTVNYWTADSSEYFHNVWDRTGTIYLKKIYIPIRKSANATINIYKSKAFVNGTAPQLTLIKSVELNSFEGTYYPIEIDNIELLADENIVFNATGDITFTVYKDEPLPNGAFNSLTYLITPANTVSTDTPYSIPFGYEYSDEVTDTILIEGDINEIKKDINWVGRTYYIDGYYSGESIGSQSKPFKSVQAAIDAFTPMSGASDWDTIKLVIAPYPYYVYEPDITINKNVTIIGSEDTQQHNTMIGNVTVAEGSKQVHIENIQMTNLIVNATDVNFTSEDIFIQNKEILLTKAKYVFIRNKRYVQDQWIRNNGVDNLEMKDCGSIFVEQNSGSATFEECRFGYADDNVTVRDALIVGPNSDVVVLATGCSFAMYASFPNQFRYNRIVNTGNKLIVAFDSLIGPDNKNVQNVKYIDNNIDTSKFVPFDENNNVNLTGKGDVILDPEKALKTNNVNLLNEVAGNPVEKTFDSIQEGDIIPDRIIMFDESYLPQLNPVDIDDTVEITFVSGYRIVIDLPFDVSMASIMGYPPSGVWQMIFQGSYLISPFTIPSDAEIANITHTSTTTSTAMTNWLKTITTNVAGKGVNLGDIEASLSMSASSRPTTKIGETIEENAFLSDLESKKNNPVKNTLDLSNQINGTTQSFVLDPNANSAGSNIMLFYNGLLQTEDKNYTLSGSTLITTFTNAPQDGEELLIIYYT